MEKGLTTKSEVQDYLQAAKGIERDIYALEQMEAELKKRAEELQQRDEKNYQAELKKQKAAAEQYKEELQAIRRTEPERRQTEKPSIGEILGEAFGGGIFGIMIGAIIGAIGGLIFNFIIYTFTDITHDFTAVGDMIIGAGIGAASGFVLVIVIMIVVKIVVIINLPKIRRENEELYIKEKAQYDKKISSAESKFAKAERACNIPFRKVDYYEKPIKSIRQSLGSLYANREKFYSVGVVPPDYRTMDCVYVLDQIFRNDLADTMREAVLLYEERAFRGDVIRGMQNISRQLGNLSSIMSALRTDINMVGQDVAFMRDDMNRVYEQNRSLAADVARSNDRLYEETKLHRYAVEALEKSNQKIVDYLEN